MKKVLLFCVLALAFASCTPKKAQEAPKADSTVVATDTVAADSATATADTTKAAK
ncbi:MAG: hypothetical protein Q8904_12875 [Bacteroidota bacterium]|nr:hypothetical protein [Bacteroidota bacterium]